MKRIIGLILLVALYSLNNSAQIASRYYIWGYISAGDNFPDFTHDSDSLRLLLISLHLGIPSEEFCKSYNWSTETYREFISFSLDKNFISKRDKTFYPNVMIITEQEGQSMFAVGEKAAAQIADSIIAHLETIKSTYQKSDISTRIPFDSIRFLLLSDVLLDNWQINNVEKEFLKTERPLRHGKNYYVSLSQNIRPEKEPFGIFGNGGNEDISMYGNNRYNFKNEQEMNEAAKKATLFKKSDGLVFQTLASEFKPVLIQILNDNRANLEDQYSKTIYAKEISFEEYFIWLYHHIYTRATNILAQKKYLKIPETGNFFYKFQWVDPQTGTYSDMRDGKAYTTVIIGSQTWFAENLSFIPDSGKYWVYENKKGSALNYGCLYNWETANHVCPATWHLPSDAEWTTLTDYLGGEASAGGKLKTATHWKVDAHGYATNESGFGALPAGYRYYIDGTFDRLFERAYFWTSTPNSKETAFTRLLRYFDDEVDRAGYNRAFGFSVRCVKD
jgi:uncharacterized protein (TIGR02145 family)